MIFDPYRNQAGRRWEGKAIVFSMAATGAASVAGALLGAAGSLISLDGRIAIASVLAVVAIGIGVLDLGEHRVRRPVQS